ncbi:hypothetical protein [Chitinophaga varians]|uniref:hypothetical protein n=1 Tax=Chitinophaga varians TaxID=2202339 RepID=UPI001CB6B89C|nr:hypothetical protein [Chitinophaga varians]
MATLAFMAASCSSSKSDDAVTPEIPKTGEWYLSEIIRRDVDNTGTVSSYEDSTVITYNPDKTFNSREEFKGAVPSYYGLYKVVYDQQNITKLTLQSSKTAAAQLITEARNTNNQLVRYFEPGYANSRYDSLVYENNKIVRVVYTHEDKRNNAKWEYTWQNDNLVEERMYQANPTTLVLELTHITKHTYSDVPNVSRPMAGYHLLRQSDPNVQQLSANEVNSTTLAKADGIVYAEYSYRRSLNDKKLPDTDTCWYRNIANNTPRQPITVSHYKYIDLAK